jgi:hypothetical protein
MCICASVSVHMLCISVLMLVHVCVAMPVCMLACMCVSVRCAGGQLEMLFCDPFLPSELSEHMSCRQMCLLWISFSFTP